MLKEIKLSISGHSGCLVELLSRNGPVIRKSTPSEIYAPRLNAQRIKQDEYSKHTSESIVIPKIRDYGSTWFEMDYLPMGDCIRFFERATPAMIESRLTILIEFIESEFKNSKSEKLNSDSIVSKVEEIKKSQSKSLWDSAYSSYEKMLWKKLEDTLLLDMGMCHGDLTFSNILFSFSSPQVGLIDFLDSFIETPLMDIIKLRQDTLFHWTSKNYTHTQDKAKLRLINTWANKLLTLKFGDTIHNPAFQVLEIINYLRIVPYIRNKKDHLFIINSLNQLMKEY